MRSRYTAYTLDETDYVVATHHPDGREDVDQEAASKWAQQAEWHGLEVVETEDGGATDDSGVVEFVARYTVDGAEYSHHERARFGRVDGQWFYVDGDMVKRKPVTREGPKVGRNEPCPCGSGSKFKRCCGA